MATIRHTFQKLSLKAKIRFYVLSITGLVLLAVSTYLVFSINEISKRSAIELTNEMVLNHAKDINKNINKDISFASSVASSAKFYCHNLKADKDSLMRIMLTSLQQDHPNYKAVWLTLEASAFDPKNNQNLERKLFSAEQINGKMVYTVDYKNIDENETGNLYNQLRQNPKITILDPYIDQSSTGNNQLVTSVIAPIFINGRFAGIAGVDFNLNSYTELTSNIGIYKNSKAFLAASNGYILSHTDNSLVGKNFEQVGEDPKKQATILDKITNGKSYSSDEAINGKAYYTYIIPITITEGSKSWAFGLSIPKKEIYQQANQVSMVAALLCLIGLVVVIISVNIFSNRLTVPLIKLTNSIKRLAKGEISETTRMSDFSEDEIGEMANSVNSLIDGLNKTSTFAEEIGAGNLSSEFEPLSDKDHLGLSLIEMRQNLVKSKEEEVKRRGEEEKQTWATLGVAQFSELLRENNNSIKELSFNIISQLVKYLNINQGGIFIINDNDENDVHLEMTACFAYDRRKLHHTRFETTEGLVGRCFSEKETVYLLEIPQDYIHITSGLGDSRPSCLVLVPLKLNETVSGVIELAALAPIEEYKVLFVEKVAESIASTISNVKINVRTAELLSRTQQQAEEMAAQEEEMRQNLEELTSTQEEMARIQNEQRIIQEELSKEKSLFANFLAAVPDAIYYKDLQSRFVKVSKSLVGLHKVSSEQDLIGKTDFDLFSEEHSRQAYKDEQEIIKTGLGFSNMEEKEVMRDGSISWVSTSKMPLRDLDGNIIGTFGITRNITKVKALEETLAAEKQQNEEHLRKIEKLTQELEAAKASQVNP